MAESRSLVPRWKNLPSDPRRAAPALLASFLAARKETTFRTYRQGLQAFARFMGEPTVEAASARLLSMTHGQANAAALDFRNALVQDGYKTATVNNRLAALRSLVNLGRVAGIVPWALEIRGLPQEAYRDTAGPGMKEILARIRSLAAKKRDPKAQRDAAIIALMGLMGLRRGEAVGLNVEDLEGDKLWVLGKGRTDQEPLTLPPQIGQILQSWISLRGRAPGPLFVHFRQKQGTAGRLSGRSVARVTHGMDLGNPHGLRHSAITEALDRTRGDVRKVAKFSRHKSIQTVLKYDDNRRDLGGEVAADLARKLDPDADRKEK